MKPFLNFLFCAGMLSLLTTGSLLATASRPTPDPNRPPTGWVSSSDASFSTRTYQTHTGELVIQVTNRSLRGLLIYLQTMRGEEVAFVPVPGQQSGFAARLDVSELSDGDYRIVVATDTEKIVRIVSLTTAEPTPAVRRATVAVVKLVSEP